MHKTFFVSFFILFFFATLAHAQSSNSQPTQQTPASQSQPQSQSQPSGNQQSQSSGGSQQASRTVTTVLTTASDGKVSTILSTGNVPTSKTSEKPLPTFSNTLMGGGSETGAPAPGGQWGPDDNYVAAAQTLSRNTLLGSLCAITVAAIVMAL